MPDRLAAAEACFLDARDLHDRLEVGRARGLAAPGLDRQAEAAVEQVRRTITDVAEERLDEEDARALTTMRRWLSEAQDQGHGETAGPPATAADAGFEALSGQILDRYAAAEAAVDVGGDRLTRLAVLGRLGEEPSRRQRRRLFLALEPTWRSIAGDGDATSPYRRLLRLSAERWAAGRSPIDANARALGIDPASIEPSLVEILEAWRANAGREPVEPWDWWYEAGAADRALRAAVPRERLLPLTRAYHAALGADLAQLEVGFDVAARPDRPPVPVAYTTFGRRPRLHPEGRASGAQPWVFGTYTEGGLGELTELIHETGHAIHIAAIRTRPAFADWPDSDALTEALAELLALDTAEQAWQNRWLGTSVPGHLSLRGRYADIMLDVCWALFEIRMHAAPDRCPNEVWAELTSTYLGLVAHPRWPWWAMRGQLVEEPGYMTNYAIGPILAAELRAAIRAARGDWTAGDSGWYAWVAERIYHWGLARSSGQVLRSVLGRAPSPEALLAEIGRAGVGLGKSSLQVKPRIGTR
ncbi:hypothetical protein NLX86_08655 [Streptomyces sp. A3M-1-3]|uniref:hypothetical protein n=1 Tax=Streptomyces sp. A3M-1-3 TaxID=2962044 RepID=UPI0020B7EC75|nr:hypothetical protein [Streptomyces sp. A3M-1-3]MCP3818181.1 hypothetical protein [Streptomyces sp. A3M-1-3]